MHRLTSVFAHVCAVCFRLPVRIRRSASFGTAGCSDGRALPVCIAPLSREPALYRSQVGLIRMVSAPRPHQLALALDHDESFAREDFLEGEGNATALALIEHWPDWPHR